MLFLAAILLLFGCASHPKIVVQSQPTIPHITTDTLWAAHFNYPVGKPDAKGYYNAQGFGKNTHLGDDWNGNGGGNTDLGDTIYAIANGYVTEANDVRGGWGNVVRIAHFLPKGHAMGPAVESLYAHLDTIFIAPDTWVTIGQPIGTIGTAHGQYYAHLHLEIRETPGLPLGGGYATDTTGYINPTWFIKGNR